jgi:ATP synthase protein I
MSQRELKPAAQSNSEFARKVGAQAERKQRSKHHPYRSALFGLGMMGVIGWSVAVPTVAGVALGVWLDRHYPGKHHYTLALLVLGLALGCLSAWRWVSKEDKAMHEGSHDDEP